jgi:nuclear transport factor 2 (NTF2) superfamily protein
MSRLPLPPFTAEKARMAKDASNTRVRLNHLLKSFYDVGKKGNGRTEELRLAPFNSRRIRSLTSPAERNNG